MTISKKNLKDTMSELGKLSWKKNRAVRDSDYFRRLQAKGVKTRLKNKAQTGKY